MERVRFIEHQGRRVLLLDYSGLQDETEMLAMVAERRRLVKDEPPGSLLTLTDATGSRFPRAVIAKIKEAAVFDRPHILRAALVGASAGNKDARDAIKTFSARQWSSFATREEALDWLVSEAQQARTAHP